MRKSEKLQAEVERLTAENSRLSKDLAKAKLSNALLKNMHVETMDKVIRRRERKERAEASAVDRKFDEVASSILDGFLEGAGRRRISPK